MVICVSSGSTTDASRSTLYKSDFMTTRRQIDRNRRSANRCWADWKPIVFMHLCLRKVMKMTVNLSQEDKHVARVHTVGIVFALVYKQTTTTCFFVVIDAIVFALVNQETNNNNNMFFLGHWRCSITCWQGYPRWRRGHTSFEPLMAPLVSSIPLLLPSSWTPGCLHHGQLLPFLHNQQCPLFLDLSAVLPLSSGRRPRNPKIFALSVALERSTSWAGMISMMGLESATHVGSSYLGGNIKVFIQLYIQVTCTRLPLAEEEQWRSFSE